MGDIRPARLHTRREALAVAAAAAAAVSVPVLEAKEKDMNLGAFSISLTVKDLHASQAFYEKFGFKAFGGNPEKKWVILKNGEHLIGLFQGMFEKNILTFNPGWDQNAKKVEGFTDVRELQRQ